MERFQKVRKMLEQNGYKLSDEEFETVLCYANRKMKLAEKDEGYLSLLLLDIVKEYFFRTTVTFIGMMVMEGSK